MISHLSPILPPPRLGLPKPNIKIAPLKTVVASLQPTSSWELQPQLPRMENRRERPLPEVSPTPPSAVPSVSWSSSASPTTRSQPLTPIGSLSGFDLLALAASNQLPSSGPIRPQQTLQESPRRSKSTRAKTAAPVAKESFERSHVCTHCGLGFLRKYDLNRHSRQHTGLKPYICPNSSCALRFERNDQLRRHLERVVPCRAYVGRPEEWSFTNSGVPKRRKGC